MLPGYEEIRTLEVHRDAWAVDLDPFFKRWFSQRDYVLGFPQGYERRKEDGNVVTYKFDVTEFCESFIGGYSLNEITDFLGRHLADETDQSEYFVNMIKDIFDKHNHLFRIDSHDYLQLYKTGIPIGDIETNNTLSIKEIESEIPMSYFSDCRLRDRVVNRHDGDFPGFKSKDLEISHPILSKNSRKVRDLLLKMSIISFQPYRGHDLDDESLIKSHDLTDNALKLLKDGFKK